jgi:hypothetical protein
VGRVQWDPAKQGPVMQRDRLHPAFPGLVALTERTMECAIGDAACRERFDFTPQDVKVRILDGVTTPGAQPVDPAPAPRP